MHYVHGSDIAEQLVTTVLELAASTHRWTLQGKDKDNDCIKSFYIPPNGVPILTSMLETILPFPAEYVHSILHYFKYYY